MVDYKEILKLSSKGYSLRQIAASVGHSHHTVKNVLNLAAKHKVELFSSSKIVTLPQKSSHPFLPRCKTVVKRMRSDGIIP